jgi:hypothetical protein
VRPIRQGSSGARHSAGHHWGPQGAAVGAKRVRHPQHRSARLGSFASVHRDRPGYDGDHCPAVFAEEETGDLLSRAGRVGAGTPMARSGAACQVAGEIATTRADLSERRCRWCVHRVASHICYDLASSQPSSHRFARQPGPRPAHRTRAGNRSFSVSPGAAPSRVKIHRHTAADLSTTSSLSSEDRSSLGAVRALVARRGLCGGRARFRVSEVLLFRLYRRSRAPVVCGRFP